MKTRITAILLICVVLSISVQAATTRGKITSIADPDRFTQSEIARSNLAQKKRIEEAQYKTKFMRTITPVRANAFFCDNKKLIAACGDFLKGDNRGISVSYDGAEETDKYSYFEVKWIVIMGSGQTSFSPISPPEGHEVIEQLCAKLLEDHLIEEDNFFIICYYPERNFGYFEMSFSSSRESNDSLIIRNEPKSQEWKEENNNKHVYRDFYIGYLFVKGDQVWGGWG